MSELRDFSNSELSSASIELWNHELSDDPVIATGNKLARIAEMTLRAQIQATGQIDPGLIQHLTNDLDVRCGHYGVEFDVTGHVVAQRADITSVDGVLQFSKENRRNDEIYLEAKTLRSLGYLAVTDQGNCNVQHLMTGGVEQGPYLAGFGASFFQQHYLVPIDNSVHLARNPAIHLDTSRLLSAYQPDLLDDIDMAIFNADNRTEQLRQLAKVNLDSIEGQAHDMLVLYLQRYLNSTMDFSPITPHTISGLRNAFLRLNNGAFSSVNYRPGVRLTGSVSGLDIVTIRTDEQTENGEPRKHDILTLSMSIPTETGRFTEAKIPLIRNPRLFLKELPVASSSDFLKN